MKLLHALDDHGTESSEETASVIRLEAKMDLLLGLVSELLRQHFKERQPQQITLSAHEVSWAETEGPGEVGETVTLELEIDPRLPQPLVFCAVLEKIQQEGSTRYLLARFINNPDAVTDLLEKRVFQIHRREVAKARSK